MIRLCTTALIRTAHTLRATAQVTAQVMAPAMALGMDHHMAQATDPATVVTEDMEAVAMAEATEVRTVQEWARTAARMALMALVMEVMATDQVATEITGLDTEETMDTEDKVNLANTGRPPARACLAGVALLIRASRSSMVSTQSLPTLDASLDFWMPTPRPCMEHYQAS